LTRGVYYDGYIYLYEPKKKIFYLYNNDKKNSVLIDPAKAKSVYIDKELNEVYDTKSVDAGNPIRKGYIKENSSLSKKK
jgi:hypothetical protein